MNPSEHSWPTHHDMIHGLCAEWSTVENIGGIMCLNHVKSEGLLDSQDVTCSSQPNLLRVVFQGLSSFLFFLTIVSDFNHEAVRIYLQKYIGHCGFSSKTNRI